MFSIIFCVAFSKDTLEIFRDSFEIIENFDMNARGKSNIVFFFVKFVNFSRK